MSNDPIREPDGRVYAKPRAMTKLDAVLLAVHLLVLGGLMVLMTLRGLSTALLLLTLGSAAMAVGKVIRVTMSSHCTSTSSQHKVM